MTAAGALCGLALAAGALLVFGRLHATRRPPLAHRIGPFIGLPKADPGIGAGALIALLRPRSGLGQPHSITSTLIRAGRLGDRDRFRIEQVSGGLIGAIAGGGVGLLAVARGASAFAILVLAGFGVVLGVLAVDRRLAHRAQRRSAQLGRELPSIAELLAFAVAAGESPMAALDRVATLSGGGLGAEFRTAVGEMRAGSPLDAALRGVAERSGNPDVERFVDGIIVAVERGTPLADVLRAQAADARAAQRRALLETAGRRDVLMLVPVVFFILPTVVAIALFPGMRSLQLVVP